MVDIVVDQRPMEKAPYDPNVIPKAVRDRVAAVDALYKPNGSDGSQPPSETPPEQVTPPVEQVPTPQPTPLPLSAPASTPSVAAPAPPAPTPPEDDENSGSWKHRFARMQGRYDASQRTIGEMQVQLEQMGNELMHLQQHQAPRQGTRDRPPTPPQQTRQYLTPEDEQNYGRDLLDVTKRAALEVVAPKIVEIEERSAELQRQLVREQRANLDRMVEMAVPDFRQIDRNPRWHRWLLGIDLLSGRVRQTLLNEAVASASAPRVISFFNGFKQEEAATGHTEALAPGSHQPAAPREPAIPLASLAAPGRARLATGGDASLPPDKPIYTRAQIKQLYEQHRRKAYVGREAEWARQEADIIAAGREGRIQ
jgi:hypothetical protein